MIVAERRGDALAIGGALVAPTVAQAHARLLQERGIATLDAGGVDEFDGAGLQWLAAVARAGIALRAGTRLAEALAALDPGALPVRSGA